MTRAFIIMAVVALFVTLYFVVPQFKAVVNTAGTTIRSNLTAWAAAFSTSEFYVTLIAPRLWIISMILGGLIVGIIAIFVARGYFSFIKYGRSKSDEIAGYQGAPAYRPGAPVAPVQAQPIPTVPVKPEGET
jgi:hypothetical protein